MNKIYEQRVAELSRLELLRNFKTVNSQGPRFNHGDKELLMFCSNDYLGLSTHEEVKNAAIDYIAAHGVGSGASRLVSGNFSIHDKVEKRFANIFKKEASVLFPSGYQANVGALSALAQEGDVIFSDSLNHASIIDGARLSKATVRIYNHGDSQHLEELMSKESGCGINIVVTEGIFSMDGDIPPLKDIVAIAKKYKALVYLDEAHSFGIMGPRGMGLAHELELALDIDFFAVTFGKALGVCGAVVVCSKAAASVLQSRARSLMYTTAPPPLLSAAVNKSLSLCLEGNDLRKKLYENIALFRKLAHIHELKVISDKTPILPIEIGGARETMEISQKLFEEGLFVQGIRPPTVPEGSSRLRVTLSAMHSEQDITLLVKMLKKCGV